jgi:hypothetical protein
VYISYTHVRICELTHLRPRGGVKHFLPRACVGHQPAVGVELIHSLNVPVGNPSAFGLAVRFIALTVVDLEGLVLETTALGRHSNSGSLGDHVSENDDVCHSSAREQAGRAGAADCFFHACVEVVALAAGDFLGGG